MEWNSIIWWIALIVVLIIIFYIAYSLPSTCINYVCSNLGITRSKFIWGILGFVLVVALLIVLTQVPGDYRDQFFHYLENGTDSVKEDKENSSYVSDVSNFSEPFEFQQDFQPSREETPLERISSSPISNTRGNIRSYNPRFDFQKAQKPYHVTIKKSKNPSAGERACKKAAEKIFGRPFEKVYISWLKNEKTRRSLEIDCYNDDLKIAIEYHGSQHYQEDHFFHRNGKNSYSRSVERDLMKLDLCETYGVYLISVPFKTPLSEIEDLIRYYDPEKRLRRLEQGLTE